MLETLRKVKERWMPTQAASTAVFTMPRLVLEIQSGFVAAAQLAGSARRRCQRMAVSELQPGSLQPLVNRPNILDHAEIERAIRRLTEIVGNGNSRLGMLIPDAAARVGMLTFEALPDDPRQVEALVRWRMAEMLPFPAEEARVSYQVLRREETSIEVLAVAAKSSVLADYEAVLETMKGSPVLILPSTVALLPLLPGEGETAQLLIHVCSGWLTAVVVVGGRLRLWRVRPLEQPNQQDVAGLASEIASEVARVLAGSSDHLKVEVGRVWLCARPGAGAELCGELSRQISREVVPVVPEDELASNLPPPEQELFGRFGASIAGLLSNSN